MSSQVVIVTGAASGMGAAIALRFAELNACVCVTDINEQDLHKISVKCQKLSQNKVIEVVADIGDEEDQENIVKNALQEFGRIDVLINCAGIYQDSNLQDSDIIEKFDKIFAINLRSIVGITNKALPALIKNKGCVINISSVGSTIVIDDGLIYCMSKAGVATFTKCAAFQLGRQGVRVNCIAPGPVKTNIYGNVLNTEEARNEAFDKLAETLPMKKCVKVEEIAELAVFLASDNAASITGTEILVDAGMALGTVTSTSSISDVKDNNS